MGKVGSYDVAVGLTGVEEITLKQSSSTKRSTINELAVSTREFQDWFSDALNLKAYGAVGDGVTDDSDAVTDIISDARSLGRAIYAPPGEYLIDQFRWDWLAGGYGKLHLFGAGPKITTFTKRVDDTSDFFLIGRTDGATYQGGVSLRGITLTGGTLSDTLSLWNLVWFTLSDMVVQEGVNALRVNNNVGGFIHSSVFEDATVGMILNGTSPNLLTVDSSAFRDNTSWGIDYHNGKQLVLTGCDIENNGTALGTTGGIRVNSTVGVASGAERKRSGLVGTGLWFESNKGLASLALYGGINTLVQGDFIANPDATRDIYSDGGQYTLLNPAMINNKSGGNIEDTASAANGNSIIGGQLAVPTGVDRTKTTLIDVQTGTGASAVRRTAIAGLADYADDAAAASGGVAVGENYRNGSVLMTRVA